MTPVIYLEPAILELERAFDRYVDRSPRIAEAFLDEVERALDQLRAFPDSAPVLLRPVRRKVLLKYPFSILYYLKNEHVIVVSVMHHKQPPGYWKTRVPIRDRA